MRGHLLPYLNGTAVILLNFSGVIVFYEALRDILAHISSPEFVIVSTALALRISFCLLVHRALIDTGPSRDLEICAAVTIVILPVLNGISAVPPALVGPLIQISFDFLIVVLTISARRGPPAKSSADFPLAVGRSHLSEGLRRFLDCYCVEELSSLYLYLPVPRCSDDLDIEDILKRLNSNGAVGTHYRIYSSNASEAARRRLPHLFEREPILFDVYRINLEKIKNVLT